MGACSLSLWVSVGSLLQGSEPVVGEPAALASGHQCDPEEDEVPLRHRGWWLRMWQCACGAGGRARVTPGRAGGARACRQLLLGPAGGLRVSSAQAAPLPQLGLDLPAPAVMPVFSLCWPFVVGVSTSGRRCPLQACCLALLSPHHASQPSRAPTVAPCWTLLMTSWMTSTLRPV